MNTARKGRTGDKKSIRLVIECGAVDTCISAASQGDFDVIAWGRGGCLFIQNKTNRLPPTAEMLTLLRAKVPRGSAKVLMVWYDRVKFPGFYIISDGELRLLESEEASNLMRRIFSGVE